MARWEMNSKIMQTLSIIAEMASLVFLMCSNLGLCYKMLNAQTNNSGLLAGKYCVITYCATYTLFSTESQRVGL
jgi:hypothetical protein